MGTTKTQRLEVNYLSVTYSEKGGSHKTSTTLSFGATSSTTLEVGNTFTLPVPTLKAGDETLTGKTFSYTSSAPTVATVNETTGEVTALAEGTTTITAKYAGDDTYTEASASFTLTVTDPNKKEVTFDFSTMGYENAQEVYEVSQDGFSLVLTKGGTNAPKYYDNDKTLRVYRNGGTMTVSAPAGVTIKKIEIAAAQGAKTLSADLDIYTFTDDKSGVWEGSASAVKFTVGSTALWMTSVTVTYGEKTYDYTFDDTKDCTPTLDENKSVKITRKMAKDQLNTICLPFDLSAEQIAATFGEGTEVYEFLGVENSMLYFMSADKMKATKPYLIKPAEDKSELTFDKIEVIADYPASTSEEYEGFQLIGTYSPATLATDGTNLFLAAGAQLKKPSTTGNTIKGFRAYFKVPAGTSDAKLSFGGIDTSIDSVTIDGQRLKTDGQVYNLNGQRVGSSLNGLAKGIYLMNGKKYVVR